jgi:hypothetical protein
VFSIRSLEALSAAAAAAAAVFRETDRQTKNKQTKNYTNASKKKANNIGNVRVT